MLCVSPYPHYRKDRPTNPCLYWINRYDGDRFNVATASGAAKSSTGPALTHLAAHVDTRTAMFCLMHAVSNLAVQACTSAPAL